MKALRPNQIFDIDQFLSDLDMVVIMVKHDHIKMNMDKLKGKVVLDCFNICSKELEKVYHLLIIELMEQVIELLKQSVVNCMQKGEMFRFPSLNRSDVNVTTKEVEPHGSVLFGEEYKVEFDNGDWIYILYESKDKDRTFQINPDRSIIQVTCSNSSFNFTDAWDESLYAR